MVEEVGLVMSEERRPHLARCTGLTGPVVDGLRVLAEIVESSPVPGPLSTRGTEAMDRVTAEYDRTTFPDRDSRLAASVVVLTLTRCFAVLTDMGQPRQQVGPKGVGPTPHRPVRSGAGRRPGVRRRPR